LQSRWCILTGGFVVYSFAILWLVFVLPEQRHGLPEYGGIINVFRPTRLMAAFANSWEEFK
jgi:hypothetical protein